MAKRTYQEKKNLLLEQYKDVLDNKKTLLPVPTDNLLHPIDAKQVEKWKTALEKDRFILAVCGGMNSGKSMLLNCLVFEDLVLPVKSTTMTSKLTIIEHGEKPGFAVQYYTEAEWAEVPREETQATEEESFPVEKFGKKEAFEGYSDLLKYVGNPEDGGEHTRWVSKVTLIHNSTMLEDITVVDTPGINDPNPPRDRLTKEWINNANCVLYLTPSGQAFTEVDKCFIGEFLGNVLQEYRLLVVNKIDTIADSDGLETVKKWLDDLERDGDESVGRVLGKKEKRRYVSALGGFIAQQLEKSDKPLKDFLPSIDFLYHRKRLKGGGWLNEKKHKMGELRSTLEALLDSRDNLKASRANLEDLFAQHKKYHNTKTKDLEHSIKLAKKDIEALNEEKSQLDKYKKELHTATDTYRKDLRGRLQSPLQTFNLQLGEYRQEVSKDIRTRVNEWHTQRDFQAGVPNILDNHIESFYNAYNTYNTSLRGILEENLQDLKSALADSCPEISDLVGYRFDDLLPTKLERTLQKKFEHETDQMPKARTPNLKDFFGGSIIKSIIKSENIVLRRTLQNRFINEADRALRESLDSLRKELEEIRGEEALQKPFSEVEAAISQTLKKKDKEISNLITGEIDKKAAIQSAEKQLAKMETRQNKIAALKKSILGR